MGASQALEELSNATLQAPDSPEATAPRPPSAGSAPRGERACPSPSGSFRSGAPHRRGKCRRPSLLPAPAATSQAPAPEATHPKAIGPLLPGYTAQAARE